MAYADDIDALGNTHRWDFDNVLTDSVGAVTGVNTGCTFVLTPLCEGPTYSLQTNGINDRVVLPTTTDINDSDQTRKAVAGWFRVSAIQNPPKRIYGEGGTTQSFAFLLGWGNRLMFEVDSASFTLQVFGDVILAADRAYHLCMVFEGNAYGNELRAYLDGVEQLGAEPLDRQPDAATLAARFAGEFGDPAGTVAVGGTAVSLLACINGHYNEWATWDGANAVLTDAEIREELFEKGALAATTITNQAGLDALADTVRGNVACCIRVTGTGTINLSADNVTFDPLASIHVQYTGTGTVNWTNTNGSNASIGSVTAGGTINFLNPSQLILTGLQNPTEVRVYDAGTTTEVAGVEAVTTGTFSESISVASVDVRIISVTYRNTIFRALSMASDVTIAVQQFFDRNYENPA